MNVDVVFGTRPEWLKLYPVLRALRDNAGFGRVRTVFTGQQPDLVRPLLAAFETRPDVDLGDLDPTASISARLARMIERLDALFGGSPPGRVVVQGDTLSTLAGAMAAFYRGLPVAHVEAGLRTFDLENPHPEELHRTIVSRVADVHFCPTPLARENLLIEGVPAERILVTGNTSMDMLRLAPQVQAGDAASASLHDVDRTTFLVTLHRRENLPLLAADIIPGLLDVLDRHPALRLIWVLHPGPAHAVVSAFLSTRPRVQLVEPLDYVALQDLLVRVGGVFTDSGGLVEECAALGTPAFIVRQVTERVESLRAGSAILVGNDRVTIAREATAVLSKPEWVHRLRHASKVYGDGHAAGRIAAHLAEVHRIDPADIVSPESGVRA